MGFKINDVKKYWLILTFLLLFLILFFSVLILSKSKDKALKMLLLQEESSLKPKTDFVSKWVPIDLLVFNRTTNQKIKNLDTELKEVNEKKISQEEKYRNLEILERSLQIQQVSLQEYNLMDKSNDKKIDYQEFNSRIIDLSSKIYQLRHSKIKDRIDGLYAVSEEGLTETPIPIPTLSPMITKSPIPANKVIIIIEAGIYNSIFSSLKQYKADIEKENRFDVKFYLCNNCSKEEIKWQLRMPGVIGTVFIGDLPIAWYRTSDCWGYSSYEVFPSDLYFMDLNGLWGGEVECYKDYPYTVNCFTNHTGNTKPEIFFGRIAAPSESEEIKLINHYFNKNHNYRNYRSKQYLLPHRSLNYIDNDWAGFPPSWSEDVAYSYPLSDTVADMKATNGYDFKKRWKEGYEHLIVAVHSNPLGHSFSPWVDNGNVSWLEVKDLKPQFYFYNLFACSNALFTVENYMAGWYVFQESNFGLAAIGSTKTGAMLQFEKFYQPLSQYNNFGTALKEWFNQAYGAVDNKCWHGGMTLIGDPTLKIILQDEKISSCNRERKYCSYGLCNANCQAQCSPGYQKCDFSCESGLRFTKNISDLSCISTKSDGTQIRSEINCCRLPITPYPITRP